MRTALAGAALVGAALVGAGLAPWHATTTLGRHVQNASHPVGFAVAACVLIVAFAGGSGPDDRSRVGPSPARPFRLPSSRGRTGLVAAGTCAALLALGAAIELVQARVGRTASLADLAGDAAGIASGALAAFGAFALRARVRGPALGAVAGAAVALGLGLAPHWPYFVATLTRPDPPVIEDFSGAFARERVGVSARSEARLVPRPGSADGSGDGSDYGSGGGASGGASGGRALELTFGAEEWAAIWFEDVPRDWRRGSALVLTLTNPGPGDVAVRLRVHDDAHDGRAADRFERVLHVPPGKRDFRIPLEEIASMGQASPARRLDLGRVAGAMLVGEGDLAGRVLDVVGLRLELPELDLPNGRD